MTIIPPEDTTDEERLTHDERYRIGKEREGINVVRGIIDYHNELAGYDDQINKIPGENQNDAIKRTFVYNLITHVWDTNHKSVKILDLGCGSGRFLRELKEIFSDRVDVHGITARAYDENGQPISDVQREQEYIHSQKENGIDIQLGDMGNLGEFNDDSLDIIISAEGINYAGDPLLVVKESMRALKMGGVMIAGPLAIKFDGEQANSISLAGNRIFHPRLEFSGIELLNQVENTPFNDDVLALKKQGIYHNPHLKFSHSRKNNNGAVYTVV